MFIFLLIIFTSCTQSLELKEIKSKWQNWYNTSTSTEITLTGNNISKIKNDLDGGNTLLATLEYFNVDGDVYYNNEKIKIVESDIKEENLYFCNNNYFYICSSKFEKNDCYCLKVLNNFIYVKYRMDEAPYSLNLNYAIPLPPNEYSNSEYNKIFDDFTFEYMNNFYSKFTDYIIIDKDNKKITIISEEILNGHKDVHNVYTTTIDYNNRVISVKFNEISITL